MHKAALTYLHHFIILLGLYNLSALCILHSYIYQERYYRYFSSFTHIPNCL